MSRPRTIPDSVIYAAILRLIAEEGEKAVAFSSVARATGLSAPSLVQRYGALPAMIQTALQGEWDRITDLTTKAIADTAASSKGPQALLKALSPAVSAAVLAASLRDAGLRDRARNWRRLVETALARHDGDAQGAAMVFAAWQGQMLWEGIGDTAFKMKDAIKRLA
jgi:AcrR family transcriptional regulator